MPGWQELVIILIIVALIFGTKKLRGIGGDLGGAIKGFKDSMQGSAEPSEPTEPHSDQPPTEPADDDSQPKA